MIVVRESARRIREAEDQKIQKMAYDFFRYLSLRGLPRGATLPEYDEVARKSHAAQYKNGVEEFIEAISNYTYGYARGIQKDEQRNKTDYGSKVYTKIGDALFYAMKSL
jgi:hypothetical protein